jgi:hypothetical protein
MSPGAALTPILLLAAAAAGCSTLARGPDVRALPLFERERPVPGAPRAADWIWPFGHVEEDPFGTSSGFRPLVRSVETEDMDRTEVLYPLFWTQEKKGIVSTRLWPVFWHDRFPTAAGDDSDTAVLPFLFWGSEPGEGGYFLLFPLGGHVKQKLLSDETIFVLFPLYARTRTGAWRGNHVLWPLVHWGSDGDRRHAFRVWPFYGESVKEGVYDRRTLLWPFLHWGTEEMDREPVHSWMAWPFYGTEWSADGTSAHTVLYPLFEWADGPRVRERSLPYPFYRTRTEWTIGEGGKRLHSELLWLWPFYGTYDRYGPDPAALSGPGAEGRESSGFAAWPIVYWWDVAGGNRWERAVQVIPFWRRKVHEPFDGSPGDSWWKLWPLAEGETLPDGSTRFTTLALLPWFRWEEFEANWGIFWELARVRTAPDGSRSTDLLFSLVRERTGPAGDHRRIPLLASASRDRGGTSWSLLEGLLGGDTDPAGGTSLRLLWFLRIPLGKGGRR